MTESNHSSENLQNREDRLMESLLHRTLTSDDEDAARVSRLMDQIRNEDTGHLPERVQSSTRLLQWLPLPLAASVLVVVLLLSSGSNSSEAAMAAIDRSIQAEQTPVVREYEVAITLAGSSGAIRRRNHTLFVRQNEFVVAASPAIGPGRVWAGGDGETRWVVPRIGPVYVGRQEAVQKKQPHRRVLETPFLSVEQILERTRKFYDLSIEKTTSRDGGQESVSRIIGHRRRSPGFVIPEYVEIEAEPKSGIVQFIRLKWNADDDSRWSEATAALTGTPEVPENFFRHVGHHDNSRRVIRTK